ncbi:MAG: OmpH family outer membrane protein [Armatimonadota bacterium]
MVARNVRYVLFAVFLSVNITACAVAAAQDAKPARIPLAYVDLDRVLAEYKQAAQLSKQLEEYRASLQKQLDNLRAGALLEDKDRQELEQLQQVVSPNEAQKKRLQELADIEAQREREMSELSAKATLTDAEKARHTQLLNLLNAQNRRAQELNRKLSAEYDRKRNEIDTQVRNAIQAAINAVAEEKGIDIVIDKKAVLRGGADRDITDAVIAKLNAAPPAPAK